MNRLLKVIFAGLIAIFLTACGGSSGGGDTTPPPSTELPPTEGTPPSEGIPPGGTTPPSGSTPPPIEEIQPPIETVPGEVLSSIRVEVDVNSGQLSVNGIATGDEIQFYILAEYTIDGSSSRNVRVTDGINWKTSDNSIAIINSSGVLKGVSVGVVDVEATYDGVSDSTSMEVYDSYVSEIVMSPSSETIKVGDTFQITGRGLKTDGTTIPIEIDGFSSNNHNIAVVDMDGVVVGLEKGTVTIEAIYFNSPFANAYGQTVVTVE